MTVQWLQYTTPYICITHVHEQFQQLARNERPYMYLISSSSEKEVTQGMEGIQSLLLNWYYAKAVHIYLHMRILIKF